MYRNKWQKHPQHYVPQFDVQWFLAFPFATWIYENIFCRLNAIAYKIFARFMLLRGVPQSYEIIYNEKVYDSDFINRCSILRKRTYDIVPYLKDRPLAEMIIATGFSPRPTDVKYLRQITKYKDGGQGALDWGIPKSWGSSKYKHNINIIDDYDNFDFIGNRPILVAMPGTGGDSTYVYIAQLAHEALKYGYAFAVTHWRGHGYLKMLKPSFFGKTYIHDLNEMIGVIRQKYPRNKILLVGCSIGSNVVTNFLEYGVNAKEITACVAMGNPFDMHICNTNKRTPRRSTYLSNQMA